MSARAHPLRMAARRTRPAAPVVPARPAPCASPPGHAAGRQSGPRPPAADAGPCAGQRVTRSFTVMVPPSVERMVTVKVDRLRGSFWRARGTRTRTAFFTLTLPRITRR